MTETGSWLTRPPRSVLVDSPWWRYGFLGVLLLLLAWDVWLNAVRLPGHPPRLAPYVLPVLLLTNHLAFQFRWPPFPTAALRILALGWSVVVLAWSFTLVLHS